MKKIELDTDNKLIDRFNRKISYLRVSLTDQCNLKCDYCYDSIEKRSDRVTELTNEQIIRLIKAFATLGIDKIRFTGGEPLLRKGITDLIEKTKLTGGISKICITTNGMLLDKMLPNLLTAGLNGLNVSLDTFQKERFRQITGVDGFDTVYRGIMNAVKSRVFPIIKVNTVIMKGINDDEIPHFADWALTEGIDLRFIEFMPTCKSRWDHERFMPENEIKKLLGHSLQKALNSEKSRGPADSYTVPGNPGRISFISAVSGNFCHNCNRLRLTSSGDLIGCLFGEYKINLRELITREIDIEKIISFIKSKVCAPGFRRFSFEQSISNRQPFMRGIGG